MPSLYSFADFVLATNEKKISSPTDIISDATQRTYTIADALKGRGVDEVVQSGRTIIDRAQFTAGSQFGFYDPNDEFSPMIEDNLTGLSAPWRFAKDLYAWTDHEIELNGQDETQWVSLKESKEQACAVSMFNGMDQAIWATPSNSLMETQAAANGGRPYSIPAFITEDGLFPSGFTTLMGVASTVTRFRNQVVNYLAANPDGTLVSAMEELWRKLKFESPETKEAYFRETKFRKFKIYSNLDGWKLSVRLLRQTNDRNYPINDLGYATDDPVFGKIPIKWAEPLDSAGYASGQPRFFFVNYEFLFPVFHSKRYMLATDPINGGHKQPYSWVVYKDCWYNWFCRSRYRQGILVPV